MARTVGNVIVSRGFDMIFEIEELFIRIKRYSRTE